MCSLIAFGPTRSQVGTSVPVYTVDELAAAPAIGSPSR
jgi:hypothetical protein